MLHNSHPVDFCRIDRFLRHPVHAYGQALVGEDTACDAGEVGVDPAVWDLTWNDEGGWVRERGRERVKRGERKKGERERERERERQRQRDRERQTERERERERERGREREREEENEEEKGLIPLEEMKHEPDWRKR